MRAWMDVAVLAKAKGQDGRFVARAAAGLPFLLEPGDEVALVPPREDVARSAVIAEVEPIDDASAHVRLEGVETLDAARQITGMHCLLRRDLIDESAFERPSGLWAGWRVVDAATGEVGTVTRIIDNPGQALIEVARKDGGALVLVPAVDDIVKNVDAAAKRIDVALPAGLLDL